MKKNYGFIVGIIICSLFTIGFIFLLFNCINLVQYFDVNYNDVHHRVLTFDRYEMSVKSDNYDIYFYEYDEPFKISSITQKKLDKKSLTNLKQDTKLDIYYIEDISDKYDFVICEMKTDNITYLALEDYVQVNKGNQILGIVLCSFMVLDGLFLLWLCVYFMKKNIAYENSLESDDPKAYLGELKIDYDLDGNKVQVYNQSAMCSLVINDVVVDKYLGIVGGIFTLKGEIKIADQTIIVEARMGAATMRLYCNGKCVAKKFMPLG